MQIETYYAPVLIPTLCRFETLSKCLVSLSKCTGAEHTELYIALDYPSKDSHWDGYNKIVEFLDGLTGFKKVHIIKREYNYGINRNAQDLINEVTAKYDRFIFTEDDNEFSPNFLAYINEGLERYKDNPQVVAICGYNYPFAYMNNIKDYDYNILPISYYTCWGVGRWSDKLPSHFVNRENAESIVHSWKKVIKLWKMNQHITVHRLLSRYENAFSDLVWRIYCVFENKYCIMPAVSKVRNLGFKSNGTNCAAINIYEQQIIDEKKTFAYDDIIIKDYLPVKHAQERLTGGNLFFKVVCFFEYSLFRITGKPIKEISLGRRIMRFRVKKLGVNN